MPDTSYARELRERRAKLREDMAQITKKAFDEDRTLNEEERSKFDAINTEIDSLRERIEDLEKVESIPQDGKAPVTNERGEYLLDDGRASQRAPADKDKVITHRDQDWAFRAWGLREQAPDHFRQAADKVNLAMQRDQTNFNLADSVEYQDLRRQFREDGLVHRATTFQSVGTNAAGGFTVPTRLSSQLEEAMLYFGGLPAAAELLRTADGADLNLPTADDTTNAAAVLSENTAMSVGNLTFAQKTVRAHMYNSKIVRTSIQLMQDTAIDLTGYIGRALGTRLARGLNMDFTTGSTATTSARGILRDTFVGYTSTASGDDLSLKSMIELFHSVDREYRNQPGAAFMMSDGIVKEVRKIVDSNGVPLWGAGLRAGEPDTLLGKPVFVNNRMVSSTTPAAPKLAVFGDLRKYINRQALGVRLVRLDERYAELLQVAWFAILRADGLLLTASTNNASKPVAHLVGSSTG